MCEYLQCPVDLKKWFHHHCMIFPDTEVLPVTRKDGWGIAFYKVGDVHLFYKFRLQVQVLI